MRYFLFIFLTAATFANQPKPEEALKRLIEGNELFTKGNVKNLDHGPSRRLAKKTFQHPYAVIVACSDSRVSPEFLFDAGIGDLFVVRVAGNVITEVGLESIGYAISALKSPVILVMGHQNCGAVDAVIQGQAQSIPQIASLIEPATETARNEKASQLLRRATEVNALNMKELLLKNSLIREKVSQKQLIVEAAYYNFATGKVEIL